MFKVLQPCTVQAVVSRIMSPFTGDVFINTPNWNWNFAIKTKLIEFNTRKSMKEKIDLEDWFKFYVLEDT